jgi:hypothetical protein
LFVISAFYAGVFLPQFVYLVVLLLLAFLFLGCSVLVDKFLQHFNFWQLSSGGLQLLLEDGFKLFGIVSWFRYFTQVSFQVMNDKMNTTDRAINLSKSTFNSPIF